MLVANFKIFITENIIINTYVNWQDTNSRKHIHYTDKINTEDRTIKGKVWKMRIKVIVDLLSETRQMWFSPANPEVQIQFNRYNFTVQYRSQ